MISICNDILVYELISSLLTKMRSFHRWEMTHVFTLAFSLYAVPEIQAAVEVGTFPITLHPPLPSLMHPRDQAHLPSGQTELDASQTGLEPGHTALPNPSRGPPVLLHVQPTPLDSDSQSSNIQNPTTQFSTVFSV